MKYSGSISDRIETLRIEMRREKIDLYIFRQQIIITVNISANILRNVNI